jgi:hypothetical protein
MPKPATSKNFSVFLCRGLDIWVARQLEPNPNQVALADGVVLVVRV